jgi:cell division protein FtsQ
LANTQSIDGRITNRMLFEGGMRVLVILAIAIVSLVLLDWLLRSDTYKVDQLQFEGTFTHVTESQLEKIVLPQVHGNYLTLDLDQIRTSVEALPWVKKAWVRRSWPNGVHVRFVEEHPVAYWGDQASLGEDGEVIPAIESSPATSLPHLSGPDGTAKMVLEAYGRFETIVETMGDRISQLQLSSRRTWRITLISGVEIVVDQDQSDKKLKRLASVYRWLNGRPKRLDLRYTNGFAADWGSSKESRPEKRE